MVKTFIFLKINFMKLSFVPLCLSLPLTFLILPQPLPINNNNFENADCSLRTITFAVSMMQMRNSSSTQATLQWNLSTVQTRIILRLYRAGEYRYRIAGLHNTNVFLLFFRRRYSLGFSSFLSPMSENVTAKNRHRYRRHHRLSLELLSLVQFVL